MSRESHAEMYMRCMSIHVNFSPRQVWIIIIQVWIIIIHYYYMTMAFNISQHRLPVASNNKFSIGRLSWGFENRLCFNSLSCFNPLPWAVTKLKIYIYFFTYLSLLKFIFFYVKNMKKMWKHWSENKKCWKSG